MNFENEHENQAAGFFAVAFGISIFVISATTTFAFFYNNFPSLIPNDITGGSIGALISGGMGVVLLDLATIYWLNAFLKHAETSAQRAVALTMSIVAFVGAAGASVAHLVLSASEHLLPAGKGPETVGMFAIGIVVFAVVANFGSVQAYSRFSLASQERVREANRRDQLQKAENEQAKLLDGLISQGVRENMAAAAPALAAQQAQRVVGKFLGVENAKYAAVEMPTPAMATVETAVSTPTIGYNTPPTKTGEVIHRVTMDANGNIISSVPMPDLYAPVDGGDTANFTQAQGGE